METREMRLEARFPTALIVSLLGLILVGCADFHNPAFNAEVGANGATVLFVPFRESRKKLWHGESELGKRLVAAVKAWARENAEEPSALEGRDLREVLEHVKDWTENRIRISDWQSLAGGLGVKYVVEGDIVEFSLRNPKVYGVYDGRAVAEFRVINIVSGKLSYEGETRPATYGKGRDMITMDSPSSENDARVTERLTSRLAAEIGRDLYGYYAD